MKTLLTYCFAVVVMTFFTANPLLAQPDARDKGPIITQMQTWMPENHDRKPIGGQLTVPLKFTLDSNDDTIVELDSPKKNKYSVFSYMSITTVDFKDGSSQTPNGALRFTFFPNIEFHRNVYLNDNIAFYAGLSFDNSGFAVKDSVVRKYRYLALGIPVGFKFTLKNKVKFRLGGGVEFPFHYKVKQYYDAGKQRDAEYFSKQLNPVQPYISASAGYSMVQLRLKYFISNFFNSNYEKEIGGQPIKPYQNVKAQMIEISLVFGN